MENDVLSAIDGKPYDHDDVVRFATENGVRISSIEEKEEHDLVQLYMWLHGGDRRRYVSATHTPRDPQMILHSGFVVECEKRSYA